jgi:hypothetical protein
MNLSSQQSYVIKKPKNSFFNRFIKAFSAKEKIESVSFNESGDFKELIESIKSAQRDWLCANANFNNTSDQEIIDYYTYMIKAYQVRYEYLIKKAKEKGIKGGYAEHADLISFRGEAMN